ncbi:hypothetical protein AGMMS49982_19850 [Bacteroidia bacterium]|nr:hypothetical protein AGMMS49982_19850 [Bacteroidia bacterium]
MIGFREPGYLWKIPNIPFVWGPVGGLKQFPVAYLQQSGLKMNVFNRIKNGINSWQITHDRRVKQALFRAKLLISSIPDSYNAIKKSHKLESIIIPETGCFLPDHLAFNDSRFQQTNFDIMWVGKFDFRKQLEIALRTIAALKQLDGLKLHICGTGTENQIAYYQQLASELDINEQIEWCGTISNQEIFKMMQKSHLFFFTSASDDTSTVVLEAISCCLPILCFDACGFGYVVNEKVGIKIPLSNPQQSAREFAEKIAYLYNHRDLLQAMSHNCIERQQELSWDNKAKQMAELYEQATGMCQ